MTTPTETDTTNGVDYLAPVPAKRSPRWLLVTLLAVAVAAVVAVALGLGGEPSVTTSGKTPPASAPDPTPVDEEPAQSASPSEELPPSGYDENLPVTEDLDDVEADLDGDGRADELHIDTYPNTEGVTTSYEIWAKLSTTSKTVSGQMTGETPNYVSFHGVVDANDDGRNEVVLDITPGGDLSSAHVWALVDGDLLLVEWADDATALQTYESGDQAANVYTVDDRLLSGTTEDGGATWQMWEWHFDGSTLRPTSLGTKCGDDPAHNPPLDDC